MRESVQDLACALQQLLVLHVKAALPVSVSIEETDQPHEALKLQSLRKGNVTCQSASGSRVPQRNPFDPGVEGGQCHSERLGDLEQLVAVERSLDAQSFLCLSLDMKSETGVCGKPLNHRFLESSPIVFVVTSGWELARNDQHISFPESPRLSIVQFDSGGNDEWMLRGRPDLSAVSALNLNQRLRGA